MKPLFFLLLSVSFLSSNLHAAENTIERVDISPKRIVLYCSAEPKGFTSQLSEDKKRIILSFTNYAASENVRLTQGNKTIEDVYVKQNGKNIQAYIQLIDKKGFTAVSSAYSKAVIVDIFAWDSLSGAEDTYRGSLLGCEHGITPSAEVTLKKAADAGSADAMVYNGIIALKKGNIDYASQQLNRAVELKTTLPDVYAALAQISRIQNKPEKAKRYQDEYLQKTGVRSIIDIPVEYQPPSDSVNTEPISLAQQLGQTISDDSEHVSPAQDTSKISKETKADTSRFASIFQPNATPTKTTGQVSQAGMLDGWMKTSIMAAIGFAATAAFYLAWLYFKWRKNKLAALIASTPAQKPDEHFSKALKGEIIDEPDWVNAATPPRKAAELYKQGSLINMEINEAYEKQEEEIRMQAKQDEVIEPLAWETELDTPKLEWNEPPHGEMNGESFEPTAATPLLGGYFPPGEVELALHLQQEQQRHKSSALHSIGTGDIPHQSYELSKIAKKFGVEKNSLEVKRTLASLEQDSGAMKDLLTKFSGLIGKQATMVKV